VRLLLKYAKVNAIYVYVKVEIHAIKTIFKEPYITPYKVEIHAIKTIFEEPYLTPCKVEIHAIKTIFKEPYLTPCKVASCESLLKTCTCHGLITV